jgi:hypothetical protein
MAAKLGCRCFDTRIKLSAHRRAWRRGESGFVDATAARRITQGLACHGYTADQIAAMSGLSARTVYELQSGRKTVVQRRKEQVLRESADRVRLDEPRTGWDASRARSAARKNGWVPLAAWDDDTISDPAATPEVGPELAVIDPIAVDRALAGGNVRLTKPERVVALNVGVERGQPLSQVAKTLGLNYYTAQQLAGSPTPRKDQQARIEAEVIRLGDTHNDSTIGALIGVHHQTVSRARRRLAERQEQMAS